MAANTKALVTVLIGPPEYRDQWERLAAKSWRDYALRHGYDIIVIDQFIDCSQHAISRDPHWQKCLVFEHPEVRKYEDAVWLDADILINAFAAPCVVSANEPGKVGVVSHREFYKSEHLDNMMRRKCNPRPNAEYVEPSIETMYAQAGLSSVADACNTGVMVAKPALHAQHFRVIYETYKQNEKSAKDEIPISHYLYSHGLANNLDKRFNWPWMYHIIEYYPFLLNENLVKDPTLTALCVNTAWMNSWFLHFTADRPYSRHHAELVVQHPVMWLTYEAIRKHYLRLEESERRPA